MNSYSRDNRSPIPKNELSSRIMSAVKDRNTKPELLLRKKLWSSGIRGYRIHLKNVPGRPDIAFPRKRIAIFVNGCFWHRCPFCKLPIPKFNSNFWEKKFNQNKKRDKKKINQLVNKGWKIITIWECQIKANLNRYIKVIIKMYKNDKLTIA